MAHPTDPNIGDHYSNPLGYTEVWGGYGWIITSGLDAAFVPVWALSLEDRIGTLETASGAVAPVLTAFDARITGVEGTLVSFGTSLTNVNAVLATLPTTYAALSHAHPWTDLTGVPVTFAPSAHAHPWTDLTGVPATFAPSAHTHAWGDVTSTPTTLAGYGITDGATMADITALIGAAPAALDTIAELAASLGDDANFAGSMITSLAGKAPLVHVHAIADVTNLQATLDSLASGGGTSAADILQLQNDLAALTITVTTNKGLQDTLRVDHDQLRTEYDALAISHATLRGEYDATVAVVIANKALQDAMQITVTANAAAVAANAASIATTVSNIATNAANIVANANGIAANGLNIAANTANVATNTGDIATNASAIAVSAGNIITNAGGISANLTNIGTNASNVAANAALIATNISDIAINAANIASGSVGSASNLALINAMQSMVDTNVTNIAGNASTIVANKVLHDALRTEFDALDLKFLQKGTFLTGPEQLTHESFEGKPVWRKLFVFLNIANNTNVTLGPPDAGSVDRITNWGGWLGQNATDNTIRGVPSRYGEDLFWNGTDFQMRRNNGQIDSGTIYVEYTKD